MEANSPTLRADNNQLERVQSLAALLVRGPHQAPHEKRLLLVNLFSLERRRLRIDLIVAYRNSPASPAVS